MAKPLPEQQAQLNQLYKETDEIYHNVSLRFGLSDAASLILYTLGNSARAYSQKELCETWSLTKTTVNSALGSLIKGGYVSLEPAAGNHRLKLASLTQSGREFAGRFARPLKEAEERALARLSEEERNLLLALSKKHLEILREEMEKLSPE